MYINRAACVSLLISCLLRAAERGWSGGDPVLPRCAVPQHHHVSKHDELGVKTEELRIKNEEFCDDNDEFCIKNEMKMMNFVLKMKCLQRGRSHYHLSLGLGLQRRNY